MNIRLATVADVPAMVDLANDFAEHGLMIHRSRAEMYERVRDFVVAVDDDDQVIGLCGLRIMWANLAEVYALAVAKSAHGRGIGKQLVHRIIDQARQYRIHRLFSLTYERAFFEKCGFHVVDRTTLPLKVWGECIRCPKHEACDEIAMVCVLDDVPDLGTPLPTADAATRYDAPMIPRVTEATLKIDVNAAAKEPRLDD